MNPELTFISAQSEVKLIIKIVSNIEASYVFRAEFANMEIL